MEAILERDNTIMEMQQKMSEQRKFSPGKMSIMPNLANLDFENQELNNKRIFELAEALEKEIAEKEELMKEMEVIVNEKLNEKQTEEDEKIKSLQRKVIIN